MHPFHDQAIRVVTLPRFTLLAPRAPQLGAEESAGTVNCDQGPPEALTPTHEAMPSTTCKYFNTFLKQRRRRQLITGKCFCAESEEIYLKAREKPYQNRV